MPYQGVEDTSMLRSQEAFTVAMYRFALALETVLRPGVSASHLRSTPPG